MCPGAYVMDTGYMYPAVLTPHLLHLLHLLHTTHVGTHVHASNGYRFNKIPGAHLASVNARPGL